MRPWCIYVSSNVMNDHALAGSGEKSINMFHVSNLCSQIVETQERNFVSTVGGGY